MDFVKKVLLVNLFCLQSISFAGSWAGGGGGGIRKDIRNPWFLYQTSNVSYCIDLNASAISVSRDRIQQLVKIGFEYWKNEFTESSEDRTSKHYLTLGTQSFKEISDCKQADLRLQFGVLDQEQKDYFAKQEAKITDYVGLTIRTDYDLKTLRGKGFVYFSGDKKESEYFPRGAGFNDGFWSFLKEEQVLQLVILHELGHVFGVQHFGDQNELMGEEFPEFLARQANLVSWANLKPIPKVLSRRAEKANFVSCDDIGNPIFRLFKALPGFSCVRLKLDGRARPSSLAFLNPITGQSTAEIAVHGNLWSYQVRDEHPIKAWIPEEQNAFPNQLALPLDYLALETHLRRVAGGTILNVDNQMVTLDFTIGGSCGKISANYLVNESQSHFDLFLTDSDDLNSNTLYCWK